jgi:hypothetical protein
MRKAILPITCLLLLGAGVAIGWVAARRGTPASEQKPSSGELEAVDEAEEALRLAGFEHAFVYRWQGGLLNGHVLLDTPQGTEKVSLNTKNLAQDALTALAVEAGEKGGKAQLDPARIRGLLVIAIRPKAMGNAGHECIVRMMQTVEGKDGTSSSPSTNTVSGRLPDLAGLVRGNSRCKLHLVEGVDRELFELQLQRP